MSGTVLFTIRSWNGFRSWAQTTFASIAIFEFLAAFAWRSEKGNLLDLTTALISIPAGALALMLFASCCWGYWKKGSFLPALGFVSRLLPALWVIPLIDIVRTFGGGLVLQPVTLNGSKFLMLIGTFGLLPVNSGIPIGIRLGMLAVVLSIGLMTWHVSRRVWAALLSGILASVGIVIALSIPSLLSVFRGILQRDAWSSIPIVIERRATLALTNGYWWNDLYERFPSAIDSQLTIALRFVSAGSIVLALVALLVMVFFIFQANAVRIATHIVGRLATGELVAFAALGFGMAIFEFTPLVGPTFILSLLLLISLFVCFIVAQALRRDLASLEQDEERRIVQPIANGWLSVDSAKQYAQIASWMSLGIAWILGWPLFAVALLWNASIVFTFDRSWSAHRGASMIIQIIVSFSVSAVAYYWASRGVEYSEPLIRIAGIIVAVRLFYDLLLLPRLFPVHRPIVEKEASLQ